jgi:prepilin-type N-terminal cleavage/methylation domain-containing protein
MKTRQSEKGFTLVELAIVMAIIGLLIGGILKGQELMENARVASTVTQVKAIEAAMTTFRDTFNAIPGDMARAHLRLPGCDAYTPADACTADDTGNNVGDGVVGFANMAGNMQGIDSTNPLSGDAGDETTLFWTHLLLADLLGGLTDAALRTGTFSAWGETHPSARIGGGFVVGHSGGRFETINASAAGGSDGSIPGHPGAAGDRVPVGTVLILKNTLVNDIDDYTSGTLPVSPLRAAQIDRRIDDGQGATGTVQGFGEDGQTDCINADGTYDEVNKAKDCGMIIQIQG